MQLGKKKKKITVDKNKLICSSHLLDFDSLAWLSERLRKRKSSLMSTEISRGGRKKEEMVQNVQEKSRDYILKSILEKLNKNKTAFMATSEQ